MTTNTYTNTLNILHTSQPNIIDIVKTIGSRFVRSRFINSRFISRRVTMASGGVQLPCNPSHLQQSELLVEYEVRGLNSRDNMALARLYEVMQKEDLGEVVRPVQPHAFPNEQDEINVCCLTVNTLRQAIMYVLNKPEWTMADLIRSRLAHVTHRVDRLVRSRPEREDLEKLKADVLTLHAENAQMHGHLIAMIGNRQWVPGEGASGISAREDPSTYTSRSTAVVPPPSNGMVQTVTNTQQSQTITTRSGLHSHSGRAPAANSEQTQAPLLDPPAPIMTSQQFAEMQQQTIRDPIHSSSLLFDRPPPAYAPMLNAVPGGARIAANAGPPNPAPSSILDGDLLFGAASNSRPLSVRGDSLGVPNGPGARPPPHQGQLFADRYGGYRRTPADIMSRWSMRFAGAARDLPIDEFVFRVEDMAHAAGLAQDDMVGTFHLLLADRAAEWFWAFRRKQRAATWAEFRAVLLNKFASLDTDAEIRTAMGQRMQRPSESFDDFCRAVEALSFRLRVPMPEINLINILKANADPKLRRMMHMHVIRSVDQLQDICQEYEHLWRSRGLWSHGARKVDELIDMSPLCFNEGNRAGALDVGSASAQLLYTAPSAYNQPRTAQSNSAHYHSPSTSPMALQNFATAPVPAIHAPYGSQSVTQEIVPFYQPAADPSGLPFDPVVDALQNEGIVCWNCSETGHTFQDCMVATRNVFCYGCGAKNIYRPQCPRCAVNCNRRGQNGPVRSENPFQRGPNQRMQSIQQQTTKKDAQSGTALNRNSN